MKSGEFPQRAKARANLKTILFSQSLFQNNSKDQILRGLPKGRF
jgi:hypothetical protein